jgi:pimeloyl-ACP methyl ester carboxylesterase
MPTITTKDGSKIYYKDWGAGQPVVFSHGWPLSADAWEDQMVFLASHGYRAIAHDRRGHGRSSQPSNGNNMDTYADDLAALTETLDLKQAVHVGHSAGGGEVARYIGRHGTKRVAKAVLIAAVPPLMLKTPACSLIVPSFLKTSLRLSTGRTDLVHPSRRGCVTHSGYKPCSQDSSASWSASRHFQKLISPLI